MTPFEQAAQAAGAEHTRLQAELRAARQALKTAEEREAILKGKIEALEQQLSDAKDRGDHYVRWNAELIKACSNIQVAINHEMSVARNEMKKIKGNGPDALEAVGKALTHEPVQREGER